jgi:hypothetical protein
MKVEQEMRRRLNLVAVDTVVVVVAVAVGLKTGVKGLRDLFGSRWLLVATSPLPGQPFRERNPLRRRAEKEG